MASKKTANLSSSLVAIKGKATPTADAPSREPEPAPATANDQSLSSTPLNFKVDAIFRRRFRQRAAEHDLKLNELLRQALDAWEERQGVK